MQITKITIRQDKNGNDYKSCELDDERKFNIFPRHSRYEEIVVGLELIDSMLEKDGKFWNLKEIENKPSTGFKGKSIEKAMERKESFITKTTESRNDSIRMSSAVRDATLMLTTLYEFQYKNLSEEELKSKWESWRKFFYERLGDDPTKFSAPF